MQELWRSHDITTDRRIVAFDDFTSDATSVRVLDASTGETSLTIAIEGVFEPRVRDHVDVDPAGRRALVSFEAGGPGTVLVDLAAGTVQPLEVTGRTSFLRAPLVRPGSGGSGSVGGPDLVPVIDPYNTTLPAGVCNGYDWRTSTFTPTAIEIRDGRGETPGGYDSPGPFAAVEVREARAGDVDDDGDEEVLVLVNCTWGGAGLAWTAPVIVLDGDPDAPDLAAELLLHGEMERTDTFTVDGSAVTISGTAPNGDEPNCCWTGRFSSTRRLIDGTWRAV